MANYKDLSIEEQRTIYNDLYKQYEDYCNLGLELNMARGKPSPEQLDLSMPLLDVINSSSDLYATDGTDCRNYGVLAGLPEARVLIADILDVSPDQVVICGVSSLNIMFDTIARAWISGLAGQTPWGKLDSITFICPTPGYDRHFAICEHFGIEMLPIELGDDGPNVDEIAHLIDDPSVKGIWCVPQYSNPSGITYSDQTVKDLANLKPAAKDFRIFWDNAYAVHHLYQDKSQQDHVLNIFDECAAAGHPDMVFEFCSTSKVVFPGTGISAFVSSVANVEEMLKAMRAQTIGFDKINQLRHTRYFKNKNGINQHMNKHADLLLPRFETVWSIFEEDLADTGIGAWTTPRGGYFISFTGLDNTAKATVQKAKDAGVTLTAAGATWPYHNDPHDSNIRIAPSYPSLEELEQAARIFTLCARLSALEVLMNEDE